MRKLSAGLAIAASVASLVVFSAAQEKKAASSDAAYIAKAMSAAPKAVAKDAAIIRFDESGKMSTLKDGKNGFNCMVMDKEAMCADANSMAFFDAYMKHQPPPEKLGLTYMLRGDEGASNTDPYAKGKTADNHWVVTGPHVMIVGASAKALGLSSNAEANPAGPYMMWPGTPYEHAMIPVSSGKMTAPSAGGMAEKK
jgi:hypothetical protein